MPQAHHIEAQAFIHHHTYLILTFILSQTRQVCQKKAAVISGLVPEMKTWEAHAHPHAPTSYSYQFFQFCLGLGWDVVFVVIAAGLKKKKRRKKGRFSFHQLPLTQKSFNRQQKVSGFDFDTNSTVQISTLFLYYLCKNFHCVAQILHPRINSCVGSQHPGVMLCLKKGEKKIKLVSG